MEVFVEQPLALPGSANDTKTEDKRNLEKNISAGL